MGRISKNKRLIILSSVIAFIATIIFMVSFLSVKNNNSENIPALTVEEASESEESTISVSIADTNFSGTGILLLVKPNVNVEMDNCNITGSALGAITVNGGTLNLKNSSIDFIDNAEAITGDGGAISVNGGTLNLDNTNISGYKVTGNGGAIYAHSTSVLNINGGSFSDCEAAYGGAICLKSSTLDINGTTFDSNKVSHSGGAIYSELSTINIGQDENAAPTSFTGHESMYYGGAICARVTELHVANASFTDNELLSKQNVDGQKSMGGGIYQAGGTAYIVDTTFTGNIAGNRGGAYYAGGYVEFLDNTNFIENMVDGPSGEAGAVMFAASGFIGRADRPFDGEFRGNVSNGGGGAIYLSNNAQVHQYGGTITGNSSNNAQGGGIYLYTGAKYFLQDGEIADNFVNDSTYGYGGGIYINKSDAVFTMYLGEVSGNSAELAGGGVYVNEGQFVLRGGSIFDNTAGVLGGGICVRNTTNTQALNISAGEIYSNTAGSYGGGIYLQNRGYDTIDAEGAKATEKIHIENVNIYSNTASYGGGIASGSGNLDLYAGVVVNENTATTCGDGVYLRNGVSFVLCGGQVYDSDNAIFAEGNTNTITLNSGKLGSKQVVEDDVVSYNAIKTNATVPIVTIFQNHTNLELEGVYINNELVTASTVNSLDASCVVNGGSLTLVDSLIEATQRFGVYVDGGTLTLLGNTTLDVAIEDTAELEYCIYAVGSSSKRSTINLGTKIETINDVEVADFDGRIGYDAIWLYCTDLKMYGGCIDSSDCAISMSQSNVYIYSGVISSQGSSVDCGGGSSNFYLEGGTIKSLGGSGIYATAGNFFLNGGEINDCSSNGIYASSSDVYLTGTSILNNSIGVNLVSSTFNMSGGKISGNTSSESGAGVTIIRSTMTMTGGEISGNTASDSDGSGYSGGGIYASSSTLNLQSNAIISGNSANSGGGGVCLVNSTLNMSGGKISDNHAGTSGGGLYFNIYSTSTISGGQVINNTSYSGAGIFTSAPLDIYGNAVIAKNTASGNGGGLAVSGTTVNIGKTQNFTGAIAENDGPLGGGVLVSGTNSNVYHYSGVIGENTVDGVTYTGNKAGSGAGVGLYNSSKFTLCGGKIYKNILRGGGAIYVSGSNSEVIITSGEICENTAIDGYTFSGTAIKINSGTLTMEGGTIHSHTSYYGAVHCSGTFNMTGGEIKNNTSVNGGGVFLDGASSILNMSSNAKIEANTATTNGGGVFLNGAGSTLNISSNAKIETNIANNGGGGVYVLKGTLNVDGGSISNNKIKTMAADKSVYGAGICATGAMISMTDGLVSNNILHTESLSGATLAGAGIYGANGTHILLSGGKISENIANGFGGGIHLRTETQWSTFKMTGGEITLNQAESGAGVYMSGGDTYTEIYIATAQILGGSVHDNTAVLSGGGLEFSRVSSVFDGNNNIYSNKINETVNHEENSGYGAGVAINGGKASIYNGTINANTVVYSSNLDAAFGGGLYITGTAEVTLGKYENSEEYKPTISHNIASPYSTGTTAFNKSSGGNIFINRDATLIIKNAEILGDGTTMQSQLGGAIANLGVLRMLGGTISGCVATTGGGIGSYGGFEIDVNIGSLSLNYDLTRNDLEISGNSKILDCVASNIGSSVAMGNKVTFGDGEVEIDGTIAIGATEKSTFLGLYDIVPATYPQITVHPNFDLVNPVDIVFAQASFDYGTQTYSMQAKDTMIVSKFVDKDVLFITGSHNHIISEFNLTRANTYFEYYSDSTLANHTGYSLGTTNNAYATHNAIVNKLYGEVNGEEVWKEYTYTVLTDRTMYVDNSNILHIGTRTISPEVVDKYVFENWFYKTSANGSYQKLNVGDVVDFSSSDIWVYPSYKHCLSLTINNVEYEDETNYEIFSQDGVVNPYEYIDPLTSHTLTLGDEQNVIILDKGTSYEIVYTLPTEWIDSQGRTLYFCNFRIAGGGDIKGEVTFDSDVCVEAVYSIHTTKKVTVISRFDDGSTEYVGEYTVPYGSLVYYYSDGLHLGLDILISVPDYSDTVYSHTVFDGWREDEYGWIGMLESSDLTVDRDMTIYAEFLWCESFYIIIGTKDDDVFNSVEYYYYYDYLDPRDFNTILINGNIIYSDFTDAIEMPLEYCSSELVNMKFSHFEDAHGNVLSADFSFVGTQEIHAVYIPYNIVKIVPKYESADGDVYVYGIEERVEIWSDVEEYDVVFENNMVTIIGDYVVDGGFYQKSFPLEWQTVEGTCYFSHFELGEGILLEGGFQFSGDIIIDAVYVSSLVTESYLVNVEDERNNGSLAQIYDVPYGALASVLEDGSLSIDGTVIPVPEHEEGESFAGWHVGANPGTATWIDYGGDDISIVENMTIYACFEDYYDITVRCVHMTATDYELAETQYIRHVKGAYTITLDYSLNGSSEILINGERTGVYVPNMLASGYHLQAINIPVDGQTITVSGHYEVVAEYYSS